MAKFPGDGDGSVTGFATAKTDPVGADIILIADSEAGTAFDGALVTFADFKAVGTFINVDTTPYTAAAFSVIIANDDSAAAAVNLPAVATSAGRTYTIKKEGSSGNITVSGSGAENIDGANTAVLTTQYESITVVCDGVEWWII